MANPAKSKDMQPQGKSRRTGRGQASPGGSGTPPNEQHQGAGKRAPDAGRARPEGERGR